MYSYSKITDVDRILLQFTCGLDGLQPLFVTRIKSIPLPPSLHDITHLDVLYASPPLLLPTMKQKLKISAEPESLIVAHH